MIKACSRQVSKDNDYKYSKTKTIGSYHTIKLKQFWLPLLIWSLVSECELFLKEDRKKKKTDTTAFQSDLLDKGYCFKCSGEKKDIVCWWSSKKGSI